LEDTIPVEPEYGNSNNPIQTANSISAANVRVVTALYPPRIEIL
jgi:hypothetical protein